jgi:pterin-4a-carbinolamine dehydratase
MANEADPASGWERINRPPGLFRRFSFAKYAETRAFLDRLAELSERTGRYPDIGFGPTYANVTLHASGGQLAAADSEFAAAINGLASAPAP